MPENDVMEKMASLANEASVAGYELGICDFVLHAAKHGWFMPEAKLYVNSKSPDQIIAEIRAAGRGPVVVGRTMGVADDMRH